MKKGYWIVAYRSITNPAAVEQYGKLAGPAAAAFGGKALVRTADVHAFESGLQQRTVVVEFESLTAALGAYNSAAYQAAKQALGTAAERDFRIVEGIG
jgi:uncharacterized protein (DUF1330 family)